MYKLIAMASMTSNLLAFLVACKIVVYGPGFLFSLALCFLGP